MAATTARPDVPAAAPAAAPRMSPAPAVSHRRLARDLRRRRPGALDALHAAYGRAVFAFLLRALDDRAAAEDVFQLVFLEAWQRAETYDPRRGSLGTWLLTIARSRAVDHLRRRVPEPRDPLVAAALLEAGDASDGGVEALLGQWQVAALLGRLPHEEAEVLRLRFAEDCTQREIAERTGLPLGTVKMRAVSGLKRLRDLLEAEEAAAGDPSRRAEGAAPRRAAARGGAG